MTDDQTDDQMELTTEMMTEALESAIDVLNALSSSNPRIDFIALQIAEQAFVASTPFPWQQLRHWDRKFHDQTGSSSENWKEFLADSDPTTQDSGNPR